MKTFLIAASLLLLPALGFAQSSSPAPGTTITSSVAAPVYVSPAWCSVAATSSVAQLTAATDNQSVSTGCTGACQKSVCKNLSQTDILCVRPTSGGNRTCLLPGDSVEFTGNTSCFFDNSAAPAVSGTQYVTAVGCDP